MNNFVERIRQVKEKNSDKLFKKANVVGIGIGKRLKEGQYTDEYCLKVYVKKKLAKSQLASKDLISDQIHNIKTDVVESGRLRFLACDQRTRKRPTTGGDSCGSIHSLAHGYVMTGTMGCAVVDKTDGKRCILSNNHVLANMDSNTETRAATGDIIVQPGTLDGGRFPDDQIATLKRWISFQSPGDNLVDAAIGEIQTNNDVLNGIGDIHGNITGVRELTESDIDTLHLQKLGRSTCHTLGMIVDVDATVDVGYQVLTDSGIEEKQYRFIHQIITSHMSIPGDSGAVITDMSRKAVGLLFAGSDFFTIASPIQTVLDEMDIEIPPYIQCYPGGPNRECIIGGPDSPCIPGGPVQQCIPGGPNRPCFQGGPNSSCIPGGPNNPQCTMGGPDTPCIPGGPDRMCAIGGPNNECRVGGPFTQCRSGGPFFPACLACGPDSEINCGPNGPDNLLDVRHCPGGPNIELKFKIPIEDPERFVILDTDQIPKPMRKAFFEMLKAMAKEG